MKEILLQGKRQKEVHTLNSEEIPDPGIAYCKALHAQWHRLDLRGIMHIQMHQAINMPLEDIFVTPDIFIGSSLAIYETPQYQQDNDHPNTASFSLEAQSFDDEQPLPEELEDAMYAELEDTMYADTDGTVQRKDLVEVLSQPEQLVILGHPGSGKTTLLRYLLLQLIRENKGKQSPLHHIYNTTPLIPLYIPLTTYAEIHRSSGKDSLSLQEFLPLYLKSVYLDEFTPFLSRELQKRHVMVLLDGLDELEREVRNKLIVELKQFTSTYQGNYFIVTSRIADYTDALSEGSSKYQKYTLAHFTLQQIKDFTKKWYTAYKRHVEGIKDKQRIQESVQEESGKLLQAIQRNPGVWGLAINPLFLTILALMQYQRKELPSRRVQLFKLCVNTLAETRLTAKGLPESSRLSEHELIKLLRPLAFTMIKEGTGNTIKETQLLQKIAQNQNLRRTYPAISKEPQQLVDMISKTGIFVKRDNEHYGFLHQIFAEYFAALDLAVLRGRERIEFIKQRLHQLRWREVILLTVGVIDITYNDEVRVTELVQNGILQAKSPYERWLQRDLLFAGRCLADDVGVTIDCKDMILEQLIYLYFTTPYFSLRKECLEIFSTWKGTRIVQYADRLIIPLFEKLVQNDDINHFFITLAEPSYLGSKILAHYHHLSQHYQDALHNVLRTQATTILQLDPNQYEHINAAFSLLSSPSHLIRQIAVTALAQTKSKTPDQLRSLLRMASDPHYEVRRASVVAMKYLDLQDPLVLDTLLLALSDPFSDVREAAAATLGKIGESDPDNPRLLDNLLLALFDPHSAVQEAAAKAMIGLGSQDQRIINLHLSRASDSHQPAFVREAAVSALGRLGSDRDEVVHTILSILSNNNTTASLRQAAAAALKSLQADKKDPFTLSALQKLLFDPSLVSDPTQDLLVRQAIATTLGSLAVGHRDIMEQLLRQMETTTNLSIHCATITALGHMETDDPRLITVLLSTLRQRPDPSIQQETISAFEHLNTHKPEVLDALREILNRSEDFCVREAAATTLGLLDARPDTVTLLTDVALQDTAWQVRQAAIAALYNRDKRNKISLPLHRIRRLTRLLVASLASVSDPFASVREQTALLLGHVGADQPYVIRKLRECLSSDPDPLVRQAVVKALGNAHVEQDAIRPILLRILADLNTAFTLREAVMDALTTLCEQHAPSRDQLLSIASGTPHDLSSIDEPIHQATARYNQTLVRSGIWRSLKLFSRIGSNQVDLLKIIISNCKDNLIRQIAIRVLSEPDMDDSRIWDISDTLLSTFLAQETPQNVKKVAISALGRIGKTHTDAQKSMIDALSKEDTSNKRDIAQALGETGSPGSHGVITALLNLIIKTESGTSQIAAVNTPTREAAIMALGKIGRGNEDVVEALLSLLHQRDNPDLSVRQTAVRALARIGHNQSNIITGLLQVYDDMTSDDLVRPAFLSTLVGLGNNDQRVSETLVQALASPNSALKRDIATALGQVHQNDPKVIRALYQRLSDGDSSVRKRVATTLGTICRDNEHAQTLLIKALHDDDDPCVRKEIATALGNMNKQEKSLQEIDRIYKALLDALSDPDSTVRREAAFALLRYHNKQPPEIQVLNTAFSFLFASDASIRLRAVSALGQPTNNQPHIIRALLRALSDDKEQVRKAAASALAGVRSHDMDIAALLAQLLQRYEPIVHQEITTRDADTIDSTLLALRQVVGSL
jgi:HEAT repeat protein/energy-coupling factor transporter ATP-binding protein EcfA2